jgi:hypothetical protein
VRRNISEDLEQELIVEEGLDAKSNKKGIPCNAVLKLSKI